MVSRVTAPIVSAKADRTLGVRILSIIYPTFLDGCTIVETGVYRIGRCQTCSGADRRRGVGRIIVVYNGDSAEIETGAIALDSSSSDKELSERTDSGVTVADSADKRP
jgi:hypothetical protein